MDDSRNTRRTFLRQTGLGALALPALAQLATAQRAFAREVESVTGSGGGLGDRLRATYRLDARITYLNHASIGTAPRPVQKAHRRYLELCETNPWLYMWGGEWNEPREAARAGAAALLGCEASEVAFTHNTTEAFNLLAHGLPLATGDEVLFSSLNHSGASACWSHVAAERGYGVRRFEFPIRDVAGLSRGDVVALHVEQIRPETRVLVFPHVDNMVGLRHPVAELAAAARAKGVRYVAVDGAQTVGMIPVDAGGMDVDVYACSPHKWLQSPKGLGLTYVRQGIQDQLRPMWVTWGQKGWSGSARKYEDYGTRNLPEVLALGDAIEFQQRLGAEAKEAHHRALWQQARAAVADDPDLIWRSPTDWQLSAALWAIEVRGQASKAVFDRLFRDHGFVFRAFDLPDLDTVRISPNVANTAGEIERLVRELGRVS